MKLHAWQRLVVISLCLLWAGSSAWSADLVRNLGGDSGFGQLAEGPNDDGSSSRITLTQVFPTGLRFFSGTYTFAYINTNGNITFNGRVGTYTPSPFPISYQPMIAPYWGDVDTRCGHTDSSDPYSNAVYYASTTDSFVVTWYKVGYYACGHNKYNSFQLILRNRDDIAPGDFDVEFRYALLQWTTGSASGGHNGLGGVPAQAGFDAGDKTHYFTVPGSRTAAVLNLVNTSNVNTPGVWRFEIRNGAVVEPPPDTLTDVDVKAYMPATAGLSASNFTTPPTDTTQEGSNTIFEWKYPTFTLTQAEDLSFGITVPSSTPNTTIPVISKVLLSYKDINGTEVQRQLGPQSITVLPSIFRSQVTTDRSTYSANQIVTITGSLSNLSQFTANATADITIVDADGNAVADLGTEPVASLAAGQSLTLSSLSWPTGSTYLGTYTVKMQLLDGSDQPAGVATTSFQIVAANVPQLAAQVSTDKASYGAGDTATISARVANSSTNALLEGTSATLTVKASDGSTFWTQSFDVPQLGPQGASNQDYTVPLAKAPPGAYTVTLQAADASRDLAATSTAQFTVESTATTGVGLTGHITLTGSLLRTEPLTLTAQVTNNGNAEIDNLPLTLSIVDPANQQVVATWDATLASLAMGDNSSFADTWLAMAPVGATYAAVLTATIGTTQRVLATHAFVIGDKLATHVALGQHKGRLLVLMDPTAQGGCRAVQELDLAFTPRVPLWPGDELTVQLHASDGSLLDTQSLTVANANAPVNTASGSGADLGILSVHAGQLALSIAATDTATGLQGQYYVTVEHWHDGALTQHDSGLLDSACGKLTAGTTQNDFRIDAVLDTGHGKDASTEEVDDYRALRTLLIREGIPYTITTSADAFEQALATGDYDEYGLFMEQVKLPEELQQEVVDAVSKGAGLLYAGFHDQRNGRLEPALGIKVNGKLPHITGITWPASSLQSQAGDLDFSTTGKPLKASLQGAIPVATYLPGSDPAITTYTHGVGRGIYMGFDVLTELATTGLQSTAAAWLENSLTYLAPTPSATTGRLVPLQLTITDVGTPVSGQIQLALPTGVRLADAGGAYQAADGSLRWPFQLDHAQSLTWTFWVTLPTTAGTIPFNGQIRILNAQGQSIDYGPVNLALPVAAPPNS